MLRYYRFFCAESGTDLAVLLFEPDKELTDAPRIVMPLEEFIDILKEWRAFLRKA